MLGLRVAVCILTFGIVISVFTFGFLSYGIDLVLVLFAMFLCKLISLFLDLKQGVIGITFMLSALAMLKFLRWG